MIGFRVGDSVRFSAEFRNGERNLFDPLSVSATIGVSGRERVYSGREIQRETVGKYYTDVILEFGGLLTAKFSGTGLTNRDTVQGGAVFVVISSNDTSTLSSFDTPNTRVMMPLPNLKG